MAQNNNDGQEVHFSGENTLSSPRTSVDTRGLMTYIKSLGNSLPALIQEQNLAINAEEPFLRIMQLKDIVTGVEIYPGFVFSSVAVLTKLSLDTLAFDSKCEIFQSIHHIVEMLGVCPVLLLRPKQDYEVWKLYENIKAPYQGNISIITFNELLF